MKKSWFTYFVFFVLVVVIAIAGGLWTKKKRTQGGERCEVDKTPIRSLYEVKAFLTGQSLKKFCSIPCAQNWYRDNPDKTIYFTVVDEKTGRSLDSSLAFFVESETITIPEIKSRIHTFSNKSDALAHAEKFRGRLIENPFGAQFTPSVVFEKVNIGVLSWIDALPFHLATTKPIFKENRLDVKLLNFLNKKEMDEALLDGRVDAIVTDLPSGILLNRGGRRFPVVRTVMRTNPRRPMYALVTSSKNLMKINQMRGRSIVISSDLDSRFIAEMLLHREGIADEDVKWIIKEDMDSVMKSLLGGESERVLLREPFVSYAMLKKANILTDDSLRALGLSVLVFSKEFIDKHGEAMRKLLFGYEQAVLSINYQPDRNRALLVDKGGLPKEIRSKYPMPIFEGANAPDEFEVTPVVQWLVKKKFISKPILYKDLVTHDFLPNPQNVGLAFCCR